VCDAGLGAVAERLGLDVLDQGCFEFIVDGFVDVDAFEVEADL